MGGIKKGREGVGFLEGGEKRGGKLITLGHGLE